MPQRLGCETASCPPQTQDRRIAARPDTDWIPAGEQRREEEEEEEEKEEEGEPVCFPPSTVCLNSGEAQCRDPLRQTD